MSQENNNKSIDVETIKLVKELLGANKSQDAVPVVQVPRDRDSFASFTGGLRENWVFVMALIGAFFWLNTQINSNIQANAQQDNNIRSLTESVSELTKNMTSINSKVDDGSKEQNTTNGEIIRRLDNLQTTVEFIKANAK